MGVLRAELLLARLRELGIATPQQIEQAQQELLNTQERFSAILTRHGVLRDADIGRRLAIQLGVVPQTFETPSGDLPGVSRVPEAMWRSHRLIPMKEREGTLIVATDDPFSVFALELFQARCGLTLEAILVPEQALTGLLEQGTRATPMNPPPVTRRPVPTEPSASTRPAADDEPIVRLVDSMLTEAVRMRASDVHVQAGPDGLHVRYRIDGVLHDVNSPPIALHGSLISRIKIMAGLNIAEKRLPQDGRIQLMVSGRPLDVRVSTLPATHGESVVMRLLDRSRPIRGLAEMGMPSEEQARWQELIHRPHGMVLVTGPTGSGKTTTLYGALALLNQPDRKLITVEDPVEYH